MPGLVSGCGLKTVTPLHLGLRIQYTLCALARDLRVSERSMSKH